MAFSPCRLLVGSRVLHRIQSMLQRLVAGQEGDQFIPLDLDAVLFTGLSRTPRQPRHSDVTIPELTFSVRGPNLKLNTLFLNVHVYIEALDLHVH